MLGSTYIKFPARRLVSADRRGCSMAVRPAKLLECWGKLCLRRADSIWLAEEGAPDSDANGCCSRGEGGAEDGGAHEPFEGAGGEETCFGM